MGVLRAGVGRTIINPPLGIRTMGFAARVGFIESIESDLTATCLILANETTKVAMIPIDVCMLPLAVSMALRQRVADAIGTAASHVLVNYNHTHSAPATPGWLPEPADQTALQADYQTMLLDHVVEAAVQADRTLQPARIAAGWGESHIGVQRREMGPDGLVFLGEVPDGETDPAVGVIRVDDLHGHPIAIVGSYGCHTVVVGPRDMSASPDFPGAMRDAVEAVLGGTALFIQACGGDIMPMGGMGYETDCHDSKTRIGVMLGAEVIKTSATLRTHVQRGERTSLGSVSTISLWPWMPVEGDETCTYLDAVYENFALDFIALPSLAEAEALRATQYSRLEAARAGGDPRQIAPALRWADWGDKLVDAVKTNRTTLDFPIQVIRINDIVIAALGGEVFAGTGKTIKAQSASPHTHVWGYSNGCVCYLPRAQDFPPGGWDINARYRVPDMLFQSYSLPTAIHPTSEERVVARTLELIEQLS